MAKRRARGELHFLWRILLIPLLAGYFELLPLISIDTLAFVRNIANAPLMEYGRNFILLAACALGAALLFIAAPGRRTPLTIALILLTSPVWLDTFISYRIGAAGTRAIGEIAAEQWPSILGTMSAALWGLMMVRAPKKREWEKAMLGIFMLARLGFLVLRGEVVALSWVDDAFVTGAALLIGAAADAVYSGPTPADLFVPACACGWVGLSLITQTLSLATALYGCIVLSLVGMTVLICRKPMRNRYTGYIFALAGIAAECASVLVIQKMI